jgi:hypothetical protein
VQVLAAAVARIDGTGAAQLVDGGVIGGGAAGLPHDIAIPLEAETLEGLQDGIGGAAYDARLVDVFHAQQPAAAVVTRIEVTCQRRDEGARVQQPRR